MRKLILVIVMLGLLVAASSAAQPACAGAES